ncbi:MAG: pilin [Candidatus Saccharibacteria bacterium]
MKINKKLLAVVVLNGLFLVGSAALAVSIPDLGGGLFTQAPGTTFPQILRWAINLVLSIVGLVSVAFLIYGGFTYITSGGNEDNAERGKKAVTNAIIGLVVVILSGVIVNVVINALNGRA